MNIFGYKFPNILIKFCHEERFVEDIIQGNIYMKESGYFRKLDDKHKGDKFDGRCPVDLKGEKIILQTEDDELVFPFVSNFSFGFHDDDKIPMFCATLLTEDILDKISDNEFRLKKSFVNEMKNFGEHIVWINLDEFMNKVEKYVNDNMIGTKYGRVQYVKIDEEYDINELKVFKHKPYEQFLKKIFYINIKMNGELYYYRMQK